MAVPDGDEEAGKHQGRPRGDDNDRLHVYKRRWYIMVVFAVVTTLQGYLSYIWPVTATSAEQAFGWNDHDISRIANWTPITYILAVVPFSWISTTKGFRLAVLICIACITSGCICRCISFQPPVVTWLAHTGQVLNGLAGPLAFAGGLVLSDTWFPPEERASATSIATIISYLGSSLCFIIGPQVVREYPYVKINTSYQEIQEIISEVKTMRYAECGVAGAVLLMILAYFPARPPTPPSLSVACKNEEDIGFVRALRLLFRKRNALFWLYALAFGIFGGVGGAWAMMIDVVFKPLGVSQKEAGWIGFYNGFPGVVSTFIIGRVADCMMGRLKALLLVIVAAGVVSAFVLLLEAEAYIPYYTVVTALGSAAVGVALNGAIPLFIELGVESCYPVPAPVASGVMTIFYQLPFFVIMLVMSMPDLAVGWISWCQFVGMLVSFPLVLVAREQYRRLEVDTSQPEPAPVNESPDERTPLL